MQRRNLIKLLILVHLLPPIKLCLINWLLTSAFSVFLYKFLNRKRNHICTLVSILFRLWFNIHHQHLYLPKVFSYIIVTHLSRVPFLLLSRLFQVSFSLIRKLGLMWKWICLVCLWTQGGRHLRQRHHKEML